MDVKEPIRTRLTGMCDPDYRAFHLPLIPSVDPERVIGVRTPQLRTLARELSGTPEAAAFLAQLPHRYYEEDNLHAFLIERLRDYDAVIAELNRFLPHVDN